MKQAIKSICGQATAKNVKAFRWFFVPALFLIVIGLIVLVVSFGYLDWLAYKKSWVIEFILIPFEIAVAGFFHGIIILWGEDV